MATITKAKLCVERDGQNWRATVEKKTRESFAIREEFVLDGFKATQMIMVRTTKISVADAAMDAETTVTP